MANYFIAGQGSLDLTNGSFVVPVGTTIYFFSPSDALLEAHYSQFFMDQLCAKLISPMAESYVRAFSIEVAPEGETVPNYAVLGGRGVFREPAGVYLIGKSASHGPVIRVLDGVRRTLKDLISGIGDGGAIGTHIYWGVCRKDPGTPIGCLPRQYCDLPAAPKPLSVSSKRRGFRQRRCWGNSSPLASSSFILEKTDAPVDYVDYPRFREFKAGLRTGRSFHDHHLVA